MRPAPATTRSWRGCSTPACRWTRAGSTTGRALHYAGLWGRASTVELLLARGAEVDADGRPARVSRARRWRGPRWARGRCPGAAERLDGYLGAAAALLAAGARVGEGMAEAAADEVAVLLEEAAERTGIVRDTGLDLRPAAGRSGSASAAAGTATTSTTWARRSPSPGGRPGWREAAERAVEELGWNVTARASCSCRRSRAATSTSSCAAPPRPPLAVLEALLALED